VKRVLVTGASGFIGRGTPAPLVERGFEVHAVARRPPQASAGVRWHAADLLEPGAAERVIAAARPTHLLHLAWEATPGAYWTAPDNLRWVGASLRLLRAFAEAGGVRAAIAGTCAEYEWCEETHCEEGVTPLVPATLYGAAKHGLREIAERYAAQAGLELAWGRVFFVFGPHEPPGRLASSVAAALVRGERAETSHGAQVRDFLYSEDLAAAFVALLDSPVEGAVNLASGDPRPIRELVVALAAAAGRPDLVALGARPAAANEPAAIVADVRRLRHEVGWEPPRALDQRAADTIAWWRERLRPRAER
jgi:nucleoside-diphosphate-sugar epimerase